MSTAALVRVDDQTNDPRLPAPVDKTALRSYLAVLEDPEALELQNRLAKAYDTACRALIGENDVQKEGGREFKKKSAWKKLARYFSISTSVVTRDERFVNDESTGESVFVASCTVRATSPWGQAADAVGACATDEETGKRKITIADAIATAETRASNRAVSNLIAMGEVSAEETTREDRERVVAQSVAEMTLAEALVVTFPWKKPEKYRDKPLGDLSVTMLQSVLDAAEKEIEKKGGDAPRSLELRRACQLIIAEKQRVAAAAPASTNAATDASAAPDANADGLATAEQKKRIAELLNNPALDLVGEEIVRIASVAGAKDYTAAAAVKEIARLESLVPKGDGLFGEAE